MSAFRIGDAIRCQDARKRPDCYRKILINVILPGVKQYHGICQAVVEKGKASKDDPRIGSTMAVPMEDSLLRDWPTRLTLTKD